MAPPFATVHKHAAGHSGLHAITPSRHHAAAGATVGYAATATPLAHHLSCQSSPTWVAAAYAGPMNAWSVGDIHDHSMARARAVEEPKGHAVHREHHTLGPGAVLEEDCMALGGGGQGEGGAATGDGSAR